MPENAPIAIAACPVPLAVYLRVKRPRRADDEADGGAPFDPPPLVRLRWEASEMGEMPLLLASSLPSEVPDPAKIGDDTDEDGSAGSEMIFQLAAKSARARPAPLAGRLQSAPRVNLCVSGVRKLRDSIVLECQEVPHCDSPAAALSDRGGDAHAEEELYVLRQPARKRGRDIPSAEVATRALDAIPDEFCFDNLTIDDYGPDGSDVSPAIAAIRAMTGAAPSAFAGPSHFESPTEDPDKIPAYTLRAPKRARIERSDDEAGDQSSPPHCSAWGQFSDAGGMLLMNWIHEEMPLLALTDEAAWAEAQADLYCYPNYRFDDEYDSNAEDCAANEYPDEDAVPGGAAHGGDESDEEGDWHDSDRSEGQEYDDNSDDSGEHRRRGGAPEGYGMFHEDNYHDGTLGRGWESEDDW